MLMKKWHQEPDLVAKTRKDVRSLDSTRWFYDEETDKLHYLPWDIVEYGKEGATGLTIQEVFRHNHSDEQEVGKEFDVTPFHIPTALRRLNGLPPKGFRSIRVAKKI